MKPTNPLLEMEKLAKKIKRVQTISNTILANACYHNKEMEKQIKVAENNGQLNDIEKQVICDAWNLRNKLALQLMEDLKKYMENDI